MDNDKMIMDRNAAEDSNQDDIIETNTPPLKKNKIHLRYFSLILISLILYVAISLYIINQRSVLCIKENHANMRSLFTTTSESLYTEKVIEDVQYGMDLDLCNFYIKIISYYFSTKEINQDTINQFQEECILDGKIYYCNSDGSFLIPEGQKAPYISPDILVKTKQDGYYKNLDTMELYSYAGIDGRKNEGFLIIWDPITFNINNFLSNTGKQSEYNIRVIDSNGIITQSNHEDDVFARYSDYHKKESLQKSMAEMLDEKEYECGISYGKNHRRYLYMEKDITLDGKAYQISIEYPISAVINHIIPYLSKQLALMLFVFILLVSNTIYIREKTRKLVSDGSSTPQKIKFFRIDSDQYTHLVALFLICILLTMGLTIYIQLLTSHSEYYITANNALNETISEAKLCEDHYKEVEKSYSTYYVDSANLVSYLIHKDKTFLNNHNLRYITKQLSNYFDPESTQTNAQITVYDDRGVCIASSSEYTGFQLSTDSKSKESKCWELLNSTKESMVIGIDDEDSESFFVAVKSVDGSGLIVMEITSDSINSLKSYFTITEALNSTSHGLAYKGYIDLKHPEILNLSLDMDNEWIEIATIEQKFDDEFLEGDYSGNYRLNKAITTNDRVLLPAGIYFINQKLNNNILYFNALPESVIIEFSLSGIIAQLLGYFILFLILLVFSQLPIPMEEKNKHHVTLLEAISLRKNIMTELFQKNIKYLFTGTTIIILTLTTLEHFFFSSIILDFLYGSNWPHKVNLFSITKILIAIVSVNIFRIVIVQMINLISYSLGSRFITIGKMLCSLIKFGSTAFIFLYACVEFGARLSYLLTGAGFAGVVIGYAGQSLINDLLTGLFIVFEGRFQVGDWITVNDWRGQVVEIGVRTTTIAYAGDVRVFNNSCLNTITVMSKSMSGALCFVNVDYHEDIDHVIDLIETSVGRYQKENPHILDGPGVHGVTELGDNGVTLRIWALPDDENYAGTIQRGILRTTKKLFEENNICIPFPQLVLHQEDNFSNQNESFYENKEE